MSDNDVIFTYIFLYKYIIFILSYIMSYIQVSYKYLTNQLFVNKFNTFFVII